MYPGFILHIYCLQVLSEKGCELQHAVRKAESYEKEARRLRYKLEVAGRRGRREEVERPSSERGNEKGSERDSERGSERPCERDSESGRERGYEKGWERGSEGHIRVRQEQDHAGSAEIREEGAGRRGREMTRRPLSPSCSIPPSDPSSNLRMVAGEMEGQQQHISGKNGQHSLCITLGGQQSESKTEDFAPQMGDVASDEEVVPGVNLTIVGEVIELERKAEATYSSIYSVPIDLKLDAISDKTTKQTEDAKQIHISITDENSPSHVLKVEQMDEKSETNIKPEDNDEDENSAAAIYASINKENKKKKT